MDFSFTNQQTKSLKWLLIASLFACTGGSFQFQNMQHSGFYLPVAGLVKVKPDKDKNKPFKDLRCTEEDKETITYIIASMGTKSWTWLWMHEGELNKKGDEISGVHPLKFLSVVFQDEYLKKVCMPSIFKSSLKRNGFLDGLAPNMTKEAQKGKLQKYLKDFMKEINLDASHTDALMEFIEQKDWHGFVYYLTQN